MGACRWARHSKRAAGTDSADSVIAKKKDIRI